MPAAAVSLVPAAEAEEAQEAEEAKVEGPVELGLSSTESGLDYYKSWLSS